ncbi:MAG: sirohydrochlorin cobaltochelatase [Verrucomicrobiota bacterium]|jgi:sirohydrochlorin cobaltochelatase
MRIERALEAALRDGRGRFGQISIRKNNAGGFVLVHRDDENGERLQDFAKPENAAEIARFDDAGKYRPLKTSPNLRRGWRLEIVDLAALRLALDLFYPGRLAVLAAWQENDLKTTPLRETLDRQSGMYRVAAKIADAQIDDVVGNFCRSDGGCLRTILWRRDTSGTIPSTKLPPEKYEPAADLPIPLLCQEACNLLVNECRKAVKGE